MTDEKFKSLEIDPTAKSIMNFVVNNLGINLCSVKDIRISRQKDRQLKDIQIVFEPFNENENQKLVREWRTCNPVGRKVECHRDTGISRPTIDKYWGSYEENKE